MLLAPYLRSSPPPGLDNSKFGRPCGVISLFDLSATRSFSRTVTRQADMVLPPSHVFDADGLVGEIPHHLEGCTGNFYRAFSSPCDARLFMPYHGTLIRDGEENAIVAESLWHDELFFSGQFRNDASTAWKWRIDENWSHSIRYNEIVNHCYHRFHYQYFHWMMDCLPRAWMLQKHANHGAAKWLVGPLDQPFHLPSLELLGIGADDCVLVPHGSIARFDKLVIPAFVFQEPLKTLRPNYDSGVHHIGWSKEYLDDIRRLAWDRYGTADRRDLRLYVSRGDASHRRLCNEAAILELLNSYGFIAVEPGTLSFARQVELFSRARMVVGLHGAGLTNVMWAHSPADVLEFGSEDLNDTGYRFLSNLCGHNHSLISCRAFAHPQGAAYADVEVNVTALRKALEHLLAGQSFDAGSMKVDAGLLSDHVQDADHQSAQSFQPAEESLARRDYPQALRQVLNYCAHKPSDAWGWLVAGRVYRALNDFTAMRTSLLRSLSLAGADPHIGAAYELLEVGMHDADFRDRDLIDFALSETAGSGQERWYRGNLLFMKALAHLYDGAFAQADQALQQAYAYRSDTHEEKFLFPWVVTKLAQRNSLESFPYLNYLAQRAAMDDRGIEYQASLDALPDDTVVVEIGAMDGVRFDTLHRSLVTRHWRAVLVEPTRGMFDQLVANFAPFPNVRCVRAAITDHTGPFSINRVDPAAVASGAVEDWVLGISALSMKGTLKFYQDYAQTEEVEGVTLADLLSRENVDRIDVLQIDTEGYDFIIFDQIDFDRYPIKLLQIELINLDPIDRLKIFERLRSRGYRYYYDGNDLTALRPW